MEIMDDPYPETPGEREALSKEVERRISAWLDVPEEYKALARREGNFVYVETKTASPTIRFYGGQLGWTRWIIKGDELNLLGQLGPAAIAIVTFLSVPTAPVAVMAWGLALSMAGVLLKLKSKSIFVDPDDYALLMALKHAGTCTVPRLAEILGGTHIYGQDIWDEARTLAALNKLKLVPQTNGTTTALVNESSGGRWSTSGI